MTADTVYCKAPLGWTDHSANPFSVDGAYGPDWTCFQISGEMNDNIVTGNASRGLYVCTFGRRVMNLEARLADFLRYERANGRTVILSCPPDIDADRLVASALKETPDGATVRPQDARWVVHSTDSKSWAMISDAQELRSLSFLRGRGIVPQKKRLFEDEEPSEYVDYIMFGNMDSVGTEYVIASKQKGLMSISPDMEYRPGLRLYFDAHAIISDGLAVRDGLCALKVQDRLPLHPYLVAGIGVNDVDPTGRITTWTPHTFLASANEHFRRLSAAG